MLERVHCILVPIDFSRPAAAALDAAINLAKKYDAEIHVLHVYQDVFSVLSVRTLDLTEEAVENAVRTEANTRIAAMIAKAAFDRPPVVTVTRGETTEEIVRYAEKIACDLIVIATHGRSGLEQFFLGSIAQHVVRYAPCPVLTIRRPAGD